MQQFRKQLLAALAFLSLALTFIFNGGFVDRQCQFGNLRVTGNGLRIAFHGQPSGRYGGCQHRRWRLRGCFRELHAARGDSGSQCFHLFAADN